jgi:hypothetical protein
VVAYFAQGELVSSSTSSSVIPGLRTGGATLVIFI